MLASSLLLVPFVFFKQDITRIWGIVLVALYVSYISVVVMA
jgi:cation:H+ antiporter